MENSGMNRVVEKRELLDFLRYKIPQIDWANETAFISGQVFESLSLVAVVSELSDEYGIEFEPEDLTPEHMDTLDAMVATVNRLIREINPTPYYSR